MDFCTAGRLVAKVSLGRKEGLKRGPRGKEKSAGAPPVGPGSPEVDVGFLLYGLREVLGKE